MSLQPTVYLSPQEADNIKSRIQDALQKRKSTSGLPRTPLDAQTLIKNAVSTSFLADINGIPDPDTHQTHSGPLPVITVGDAYPPCILPIQDLQTIKLADLKMDTHHRGQKLVLQRASPVVEFWSRSWTVVKDEDGNGTDAERLEIFMHNKRLGKEVLEGGEEEGEKWVVKEPWFTANDQGENVIRIHHPTDLVALSETVESEDQAERRETAKKRKDEGNAALKSQDPLLARNKYTAALEAAANVDIDLTRDIHRNRAHVNLLLGCLDDAKHDAKASLIGLDHQDQRSQGLDAKAYFRAACAAYGLGEYSEAKTYFQAQKNLVPTDKDAQTWLKRIAIREREQAGVYDFPKIRVGLSTVRPGTSAADFTTNTEVRASPGKGRGLFATRDVMAGEMVMCERAFCMSWGSGEERVTAMTYDIRDEKLRLSPIGLVKLVVQRLLENPSQIAGVMDLFGDWQGEGVDRNKDGPVVDVFRIHDIVSRNAFSPGEQLAEGNGERASVGLWRRASYINHSCVANLERSFVGDLMVLRAARKITAGEELFHTYDGSGDYDARQAKLMDTWGFECDCELCKAEKADGREVREKRMGLVGEVDAFLEREGRNGKYVSRLAIAKGKRLARAIEETYDEARYAGLPKVAAKGIEEWLASAKTKS